MKFISLLYEDNDETYLVLKAHAQKSKMKVTNLARYLLFLWTQEKKREAQDEEREKKERGNSK